MKVLLITFNSITKCYIINNKMKYENKNET